MVDEEEEEIVSNYESYDEEIESDLLLH